MTIHNRVSSHTDIGEVDAWDVYYGLSTMKFTITIQTTDKTYSPVFMVDECGYPTDFIGWNDAK